MEQRLVITETIKLGVSACQFGARVRWNHRGWDRLDQIGRERLEYCWTPVCPEVAAGLGVPRPPIRLVSGNGEALWRGRARLKSRSGEDVSAAMREGCEDCLRLLRRAGVCAFVFMEGSPSCGVYRTSLRGRRMGKPPGAFGSLLLDADFFLIPAVDLESPVKWWDWRRRLHAFVWLQAQPLSSKAQVYAIWNHFKFVCQEIDQVRARQIGHELAQWPKRFSRELVDGWRSEVLRLLRRPSSYQRIQGYMTKHAAHYRRTFGLGRDALRLPGTSIGKRKFIDELERFERRAREEGYPFSGAPVSYQPVVAARRSRSGG